MSSSDPWTMYYVVRKDRPLTLGRAMALGGAGAVACSDRYRESWARSFKAWAERPRKVALRAGPDEFEPLRTLDGITLEDTLICLPPRRKSERGELLSALKPFTDARRPADPPPAPEPPAVVYVIRPGVVKTMGKAIAQAGHGALMCAERLGSGYADAFARWRAAGMRGDLRTAGEEQWERLKAEIDCVAVADAGLTQVAPGTETVLAAPPLDELAKPLAELSRIP